VLEISDVALYLSDKQSAAGPVRSRDSKAIAISSANLYLSGGIAGVGAPEHGALRASA